MVSSLKNVLRDLLPLKYQVPAKYWFNRFASSLEPEMKLLKAFLSGGEVTIDIGGNRGAYAYLLSELGATVEVFEPNPVCSRVLLAWALAKPNVRVHGVALSDRNGSAKLYIPMDDSGTEHDASASIAHSEFSNMREQSVETRTLDSYEFDAVEFIKIDVEGHESSVIQGAERTISSSQPALLVEIEQRHNDRPITEIFEKILEFGYSGFYLVGNELFELAHFELKRDQSAESFESGRGPYINNFFFFHNDKIRNGRYSAVINQKRP